MTISQSKIANLHAHFHFQTNEFPSVIIKSFEFARVFFEMVVRAPFSTAEYHYLVFNFVSMGPPADPAAVCDKHRLKEANMLASLNLIMIAYSFEITSLLFLGALYTLYTSMAASTEFGSVVLLAQIYNTTVSTIM